MLDSIKKKVPDLSSLLTALRKGEKFFLDYPVNLDGQDVRGIDFGRYYKIAKFLHTGPRTIFSSPQQVEDLRSQGATVPEHPVFFPIGADLPWERPVLPSSIAVAPAAAESKAEGAIAIAPATVETAAPAKTVTPATAEQATAFTALMPTLLSGISDASQLHFTVGSSGHLVCNRFPYTIQHQLRDALARVPVPMSSIQVSLSGDALRDAVGLQGNSVFITSEVATALLDAAKDPEKLAAMQRATAFSANARAISSSAVAR